VAFGVAAPFLPAFLSSRGLAPEQIGTLLSAAAFIRLVSGPVAGRLADRLHAIRGVLALCTAAAALFACGYLPASTFSMLLIVGLLHAAMLAPTTTLADALAVRAAASSNGEPHFEYGWVRGTGSAAFIVGSLASGQLLNALPLASALIGQAALLLLAAAAALFVPAVAAATQRRSTFVKRDGTSFSILMTNKPFLLLVLTAALILGSHAMHDAFAMIAWNAAGISPGLGSVLWSEQVAAEVLVFVVLGPLLLHRMRPEHAMLIAALAATVRWVTFAASSSVVAFAAVEPLHGITFALFHLACMRVLVVVTPARVAATAQAFYAVGIGATSAAITFASGFLYADAGRSGFLLMALLSTSAIPIIWLLARVLRPA
jgi:MFS transporter, PPP family, 3-phenylpropionic acid transporter